MYTITRQIGIDAGHRVTHHGSKCRNLHGHRYTIQATCEAESVIETGEQQGMVLDFGFLKDEMMEHIDAICDHGMMLWVDDPLVEGFLPKDLTLEDVKRFVASRGWSEIDDAVIGKMILLREVPTAENLAKHWFNRLEERVHRRSEGHAKLTIMEVWETPNCVATYTPDIPEFLGQTHGEGR